MLPPLPGVLQTNAAQLALRTAAYAVNNFPSQRPLSQYELKLGFRVSQSV